MEIVEEKKNELLKHAEIIEGKKNASNGLRKFVEEYAENLKETLTDLSPIPENKLVYRSILAAYEWICWCMYFWTFSKLVCTIFLTKILLRGLWSYVIVSGACIGFLLYTKRSNKQLSEKLSWGLLVVAICDPVLVDYSSARRKCWLVAPPPLVIPLSVLMTLKLLGPRYGVRPRENLLVTLVAPAITFYLVYGIITDSFGVLYVAWVSILVIVSIGDFQAKIGHFVSGVEQLCIVYEQFYTIFILFFVNFLLSRLFSTKEHRHHHGKHHHHENDQPTQSDTGDV